MWDEKNEIIYKLDLSKEKKELLEKIMINFNMPDSGVVLLFDDEDYKSHPNDLWSKNYGLHMNVRLGEIEECSPDDILKIIKSKKYTHFIWFSKRVSLADDIEFSWNFAHELRHLEQDVKSFILSWAGCFLYNNLGRIEIEEPKINITVPTELDAELSAWRTGNTLFGDDSIKAFLHDKASIKNIEEYKLLVKHNPYNQYNVIEQTVAILKKYKTQLQSIHNLDRQKNKTIKEFNIDLACDELNSFLHI